MTRPVLAAIFVLALWWLSTAAVLRLVWLGRSPRRITAVSVLGALSFSGLWLTRGTETVEAAYIAFASALMLWGWNEVMFLLGIVTGPRKIACPVGARGWHRFRCATAALIHHELALTAVLVAVLAIVWGQPNKVGLWTYTVLWVMRLSAKFNVFLGVRNLSVQFIPEHLKYLASYFRLARGNWLMPASLVAGTAVVVLLARSLDADATPFVCVERTLVATLLSLAVLEHMFLALPVPDALLWRWATRAKSRRPTTPIAP